jgi:hypothetical protein
LSPGGGETLRIELLEWSPEADGEKLAASLKEKGGAGAAEVLNAAKTIGFVWLANSPLGYSVRYAARVRQPDGGERVVLATSERFGRGNPWKVTGPGATAAPAVDYPFTVVELRLNKGGQGNGKMSLTSAIEPEEGGKSIRLSGYDAAPIVLRGVKRDFEADAPQSTAKPAAAAPKSP